MTPAKPLKHPLTSAGSICSVLYRERQIFKTSFPSPSLFSVVHLVSITVASLTHGLLVTLVRREKNAGIRNNETQEDCGKKFKNSKEIPLVQVKCFWQTAIIIRMMYFFLSILEKRPHQTEGKELAAVQTSAQKHVGSGQMPTSTGSSKPSHSG